MKPARETILELIAMAVFAVLSGAGAGVIAAVAYHVFRVLT